MNPQQLDDIAEEIRWHMEQNGNATGSIHARSVLHVLLKLGYNITTNKPKEVY
jgi:hypothetical protein